MSDTLLEPEDQMSNQRKQLEYEASEAFDYGTRQRAREKLAALDTKEGQEHQVTKSGTCVIPGCPCRGWSAQETTAAPDIECQFCDFRGTFAEGAEHRKRTMHLIRTVTVGDLRRSQSSSEHQPAARGGGDGELSMRDFDYHQYGDVTLNVTNNGVTVAIAYIQGRGREAKEWAEKISAAYNHHQSLVAERESYTQLLKAAKSLIAMNNCNYGRSAMRERGGFTELEKAVEAAERVNIKQRSTSA